MFISFYITINCVWAFQLFPTSYIFSLSADCIVVSHCAFNVAFTSVIINDVDYFFMSLSKIYISCFVKCWSKSCACFSIRLFVFLLLSCKFFLYLDISSLSDLWIMNIFFPVSALLIHINNDIFWWVRRFEPNLIYQIVLLWFSCLCLV